MSDNSVVGNLEERIDLLKRNIQLLLAIKNHQPVGIIKLSELVDMPKHKIRYSLRLLEKDGIISPSKNGAITTEKYEIYFKEITEFLDELKKTIQEIEKTISE